MVKQQRLGRRAHAADMRMHGERGERDGPVAALLTARQADDRFDAGEHELVADGAVLLERLGATLVTISLECDAEACVARVAVKKVLCLANTAHAARVTMKNVFGAVVVVELLAQQKGERDRER